mgnify:FL=1|jgi:predicted metalloprotease
MRWQGRRESSNVEDRRSTGGRRVASIGGIGTIIVLLIVWLMGGNPMQLLQTMQAGDNSESTEMVPTNPHEEELKRFLGVVLAETEDVWIKVFNENGDTYRQPTLVLFRESTESACGFSSAATGPFYCPGDEKVYIDLSFLEEMQQQLNAPGDFVQAYIVAHEVGHHVQKLMGIMDRYNSMRGELSEKEFNKLTVMLELQADFLAGVWAHHMDRTHALLEPGDIEEAMNAANAIGDDRLQRQSQGYVVPDSFTHGTSAQRMRWFMKGYETGDISQGDTFNANEL